MFRKSTILILGVCLVQICGRPAPAQSKLEKLEVGAQFTTIRLSEPIPRAANLCFGPVEPAFRRNINGIGGRVSYNVTDRFAVETEMNYFPVRPREHFFQSDPRWQGLFGARAGWRKKRFAVFGKVRPGFLFFKKLPRITDVQQEFLAPFGCVFELVSSTDEKKTVFNVDFGGGAEFYLPKRIFLRVDIGDTVIYYPTQTPSQFNPGFTTHNLQFSAGVGLRF